MDEDFTSKGDLSKGSQDERFLRLMMDSQVGIYSFIVALVHNRNDSDDIMQETVTLMWRKFDEFEEGTNFTAWGISVARNMVMKFFERHLKSRLTFNQAITAAIEERTISRLDDINPRLEALRGCIKKLSRSARKLIEMRYEQKIPAQKIADLLGLSIHKLYRSLARIHKSLELCVRRTLTEKGLTL